jgi:hypothetical protein
VLTGPNALSLVQLNRFASADSVQRSFAMPICGVCSYQEEPGS